MGSTIPEVVSGKIKKATGIAVHVLLLAETNKVIISQKDMIANLRNMVSIRLEKRYVGSAPSRCKKEWRG